MKRCNHAIRMRALRVEYAPGVESPYIDRDRRTGEPIRSVLVDVCTCLHCGTWLPLGPSNDEPDAVKVEMRAAELAVLRGGAYCSNDAWAGWESHRLGWEPCPSMDCQAAWLAREIWDHARRDDWCPDGPHCGCDQHGNAPNAEDDE